VSELLAVLLAAAGGFAGGLLGIGGGILFVPALTVFLDYSQVEAVATSLLMIIPVALVGVWRQQRYGNVRIRDGAIIGLTSLIGVGIGVVAANEVPARALELGFAILVLFIALRLARRALRSPTSAR
jgi:uncharacterized membrane protein YfcA